MDRDIAVYVSALHDSLKDKQNVLQELLKLTQEQEQVLDAEEVDLDHFDEIMQEKEGLIGRVQELDRGFENLFQKIGGTLKENAGQYREKILEMQDMVRGLTGCAVKIQALEQKNKDKFAAAIAGKRKEIRDFNISNKTAASYYQNMANQHHEWQSYFYDKKK